MKFRDLLAAPPPAPQSLKAFLETALAQRSPLPELYATTRRAFPARRSGGEVMTIQADERVRVTDAGQFNDVGITTVLDEPKLHQARAALSELHSFYRGFPASLHSAPQARNRARYITLWANAT